MTFPDRVTSMDRVIRATGSKSSRESGLLARVRALRALVLSLIVPLALGLAVQPSFAQACNPGVCTWDACHTPAFGAVSSVWGDLEPASGNARIPQARDTTDFGGLGFYSCATPYYEAVDTANGWVFVTTNKGVQIWNATTNPAEPTLSAHLCNDNAHAHPIPFWPTNNEENRDTGRDVAVPKGVDTVLVTGHKGPGVVIWNTASKVSPQVVYQDHGNTPISKVAASVWATTINGTHYAWAAIESSGVHAYNVTRALSLSGTPCLENQPSQPNGSCAGVFQGRVGSRTKANSVDGWSDQGAGEHLIALVGAGGAWGVDVWDVSNPTNPRRKMNNTSEIVISTALWKDASDGDYYLAIRRLSDVRIYRDAGGCFTSPGECSLSSLSLVWSMGTGNSGSRQYVTYTESGSVPHLYFGAGELCVGNAAREYLFDITTPSNPQEVSDLGYWGFYYRSNETPLGGGTSAGFNFFAPRMARFDGEYLYRAANSVFDIHRLSVAVPTLTVSGPSSGFIDQGIPFSAVASNCTPSPTYNWTASGGGVVTGSGSSVSIEWSTVGTKQVTVTNSGCPGAQGQKTINISDPAPMVTGVSVDPAIPLICQNIQLTALGVGGQPPLNYAWDVFNTTGTVASGSGPTLSTFAWQTGAGDTQGPYTAEVTVTNSFDPVGETASQAFNLVAPPALAITAGPSVVGPNPPPGSTVEFTATTAGAAEWTWDFGDGTVETYTDPSEGENPTHTYTQIGNYQVTLTIENCLEASGVTGGPITVQITTVNPLEINEFAAACPFGVCAFSPNQTIVFSQDITGDPDHYSYDWNGDGTFEECRATQVNSHSYSAVGTYLPEMRIHRGANNSCVGGEVASRVHDPGPITIVNVGPPPPPPPPSTVTISGPSSGTVNQTLNFTAGSSNCSSAPSSWTWTFENGQGSASGNTLQVSYDTAGVYQVRVQANNGNCSTSTAVKSVSISTGGGGGPGGGNLNANFTFSPANPSAGQSVGFDGTGSTGNISVYSWNFGDGSGGATGANVNHTFASNGTYSVTLSVVEAGCGTAPSCFDEETRTVTVGGGGPPAATLTADFDVDIPCQQVSSIEVCQAVAGQSIAFTDSSSSTGDPINTWTWVFGDGGGETGPNVTHRYGAAGSFTVILRVSNGNQLAQAVKQIDVAEPEVSGIILPWVVQGQAALDQVSALYVHNPSNEPMIARLSFLKRPAPSEDDPAPHEVELAPGATAYYADVMAEAFELDNVAGFLMIENADTAGEVPVVSAFHRTFQLDGTTFGQSVPGVTFGQFPKSSKPDTEVLHLIGLNDNEDRLGFFGITNPNDKAARFQLRFYNRLGERIGEEGDPLSVAAFGQRQFQVNTIRNVFGISKVTDYRVDIEVLSGGPIYPYGANLRLGTEDPSFVRGSDPTLQKVYLIGALATEGLEGTLWKTDAVISNVSDGLVQTEITYVNVGLADDPLPSQGLALLAGETRRLTDVLVDRFGVNAESSLGLLTFVNQGAGGVYPLIHGETYDSADPTRLFGQFMPAFTEADAAEAGQRQILAGMQQDENYRTTLWLVNPAEKGGMEVDLIYRGIDGSILGTTESYRVPAGRMRQINPSQHPIPEEGVPGGFSIQIIVRSGMVLSAAQVVNNFTNDPAFVPGSTR